MKSYSAGKKLMVYVDKYRQVEQMGEDEGLKKAISVDQVVKNGGLSRLNGKLVHLSGLAEHKLVSERAKFGVKADASHSKLDIFVRTTEISHGFPYDTHHETSVFNLSGLSKIQVQLDDESTIPVLG